MPYDPNEKVREILKRKKGSIKNAPLEEGSPSWDEILDKTLAEVEQEAKKGTIGYYTIKKLLKKKEYNR